MVPSAAGLSAVPALRAGRSGCSYPTDATPYPGLCAEMFVARWSPSPKEHRRPGRPDHQRHLLRLPGPGHGRRAEHAADDRRLPAPRDLPGRPRRKAVTMSPGGALDTELGYTVTVSPAVASLAGCSGLTLRRRFTTGDAGQPPRPASPRLCRRAGHLHARCAGQLPRRPLGGLPVRARRRPLALRRGGARLPWSTSPRGRWARWPGGAARLGA